MPWLARRDASALNAARNSAYDIGALSTRIAPARSTVTTRPLFGSSGRASARGNWMSTPPCIIGAVIMKITSNSSITSIRLTTLISALSARRSRRRRATSDVPFADEERDHRRAERLEESFDPVQAAGEDFVGERRRDRDRQRRRRRNQRLGDAWRDGRQVARPAARDADESVDDAEHRAEKADERTDRGNRREPRKVPAQPVPLRRCFRVENQVQRLDLRSR